VAKCALSALGSLKSAPKKKEEVKPDENKELTAEEINK
jgi:hypothetical protein